MNQKVIDGKICQNHNCHYCCIETEMLITKYDVSRIVQATSIPAKDFVTFNEDGFRMLRNRERRGEEKCFFLDDTGLCSIYNHRPEGCRYYPIIWDLNKHLPRADDLCPNYDEFTSFIPSVENKLENFILKIFGGI